MCKNTPDPRGHFLKRKKLWGVFVLYIDVNRLKALPHILLYQQKNIDTDISKIPL